MANLKADGLATRGRDAQRLAVSPRRDVTDEREVGSRRRGALACEPERERTRDEHAQAATSFRSRHEVVVDLVSNTHADAVFNERNTR